jgi:hypothetical protein
MAGTNDTVNRIVVSKIADEVVKMDLQVAYHTASSPFYTYATIRSVYLNGTNHASFDEYDNVLTSVPYHFSGSATLSSNMLSVTATATDSTTGIAKPYNFSGIR